MKKNFPIFAFSSQFFLFFPDFSPIFLIFSLFFPIFGKFSVSGVALCPPCHPSGYATASHQQQQRHHQHLSKIDWQHQRRPKCFVIMDLYEGGSKSPCNHVFFSSLGCIYTKMAVSTSSMNLCLSYHLIWSVLHDWLHCSISIMTINFEHY